MSMRWFAVGLALFGWIGSCKRRRQQEAGETELALQSDWEIPSDVFAPETMFETQPAELVTQPLEEDVKLPRPKR